MKNAVVSFLIAFITASTINAQNKLFNLDDASTSKLRSTSIFENKSPPTFLNASKSRELVINPVIQSKEQIHVNDTINLSLFSDKHYKAFVDKIDEDINGTTTIRARILDSNFGYCIISTFNGKSFMSVDVPDKNELYLSKFDQKTKKYYLLLIDKSKQKALEGAPSLIPLSSNQPTNYLPTNNLPTYNPQTNQLPISKPQAINSPKNILPSNSLSHNYSTINATQYLNNQISWPTNKIVNKTITENQTMVSNPNSQDTVTLMIVYTPAAAAWSSANETDINNTISLLMAKAQLALDNSNTLMTIKLVYTGVLNYYEYNNSDDLYFLKEYGDKQMDEVHYLRDAYDADMVVLLENIDFAGGIGYLLNTPSGNSRYAFSISRVQQASWTYSTVHEIAHNMGCHHPKLQNFEPGPGLYSYSAGWRWNGIDDIKYCDVMTYESGAYFADGINTTTLPYFSNPDIQYQGVPTGNAVDGDNARTIRQMKSIVAAYRTGISNCKPPTVQASNFTISSITDNSMTIEWTRGDGDSVLIVARQADIAIRIPESETAYFASSIFGVGNEIAIDNYVVYNGTGVTTNITSLSSGMSYYFDIYEYNSSHCYLKPAITGLAKTTGNPTGNSVTDSLALVALYNQCGGPNWTRKANWLTGPLNTWEDVVVENGRVVELNQGSWFRSVPAAGLVGTLPDELSNLTKLRKLDLSINKLSGTLPESFSALKNLKELYLRKNQFNGTMPESWSKLVNLWGLSLEGNQLTGTVPEWISSMDKLLAIDLSNNQITGTLPESWSKLVDLQYLYLAGNNLTGSLPDSWSNLIDLEWLTLGWNPLTGILPESWSAMVNLRVIVINNCQLSGELPGSWSSLRNLELFMLDRNQLTGNLPESWSLLSNLKILDLNTNKLNGSLPDSWSKLTNLTDIQMGNNQLTGNLPESWSALSKLQSFSFSTNQFSGSLPESWSVLKNLNFISIAENQLKGTLPNSWSSMVNLQRIYLAGNQITGSLPASWSACEKLSMIYLNGNQLDGPLPESWQSLENLTYLTLDNNQFVGSLPEKWSSLVNLQGLGLSQNQLTGNLSASWSTLVNLKMLDIGSNQLSGSLPESWTGLVKIEELRLYNNKLSELPNLSSLTNLSSLLVHGNSLDFGDIEPNFNVPKYNFSYSLQAPVGLADTLIKKRYEEFRISVTVGGNSNKYQWYKDGAIISGATGTEFVIPSVSTDDAGDYTCQITNTVATELTLHSRPITLQILDLIYTQNIPLFTGWNILSANVVPSTTNLKDIVQPMITAGTLNKVMDESGKMIEDYGIFGGWQNGIGDISQAEGYKVNMSGADTLELQGKAVILPYSINLSAGWNIVSYPCANAQSALTMVQPLIDAGKLIKVMDETGKVIEDFGSFGGWQNNIGDFKAGKGYKIHVRESGTLVLTSSELRSTRKVPTVLPSAYFTKAFKGNGTDHMNIHLVDLAASEFQVGDELGIFDGRVCVGSAVIGEDQMSEGIISIPASCNDGLGGTENGFTSGHPVELKLYREGETFNLTVEKIRGSETFEKDGSLFATIRSKQPTDVSNTDGSIVILCHPNPFDAEIQIDIQNGTSREITVDIYNLFGQKIKRLYSGINTGLLHLKWNGANYKGNRVDPGVYLCRVNDQLKKIVFIGGE